MFKVDTHVHTIASGHAYGTIMEMSRAAQAKGLELIVMTDHGPSMPGGPHRFHFSNLIVLPPYIEGVEVLRGIEANVVSEDGDLDLAARYLERLDWVAVGLHDDCLEPMSPELNTKALIRAIESGYVDVVVHPGNPRFPIDHNMLVRAIAEAGIAMEINNSSLISPHRKGSDTNCEQLAKLAARLNVRIVLGSDAHSPWQVGELDMAYNLAVRCGIKAEQILNFSPERIKDYLKARGKKRFTSSIPTV